MTDNKQLDGIHKFYSTTLKNISFWFPIPVILAELLILFGYISSGYIVSGLATIFLGNLAAYLLISWLYFWKSGGEQLDDKNVRDYFSNNKISLRPLTGYTEICIYVFFFIIRPDIIIGYLVLRGVVGYRGDEEKTNLAEIKGELNSIKAIGMVINIFLGVIAAALLHHSNPLTTFLSSNFGWIKTI